MSRPVFLQIDLAAMAHNLNRVRQLAPNSKILAMIKANAYGHGIVDAAKALAAADAFGVACIEEAVVIRDSGASQNILLMEGVFSQDEVVIAAEKQFGLVVHNQTQLNMLQNYHGSKQLNVWLKVDTGMHRLGIHPEEIFDYHQALLALECVERPVGLMTHFAQADDLTSQATEQQIALFNRLKKDFPGPASLANSAGTLAWQQTHADWVRPGLMLYGVSPFADKVGADFQLKPAMRFSSRLIAVSDIKKDQKVGYGATWQAESDTRIGVVAVGYGDGYPQLAAHDVPVLVSGVRCSLAGRVSMDMLTVDLSRHMTAGIGDEVVLWGDELPVELVARQLKASPYELLTRMTPRPKRYTVCYDADNN